MTMPGVIDDVLSSVHYVFLPHCSDDDDDAWEPVDDNELEHAEAARANGYRACRDYVQYRDRADGAGRRGQPHCLKVSDAGIPVGPAYEECFSIPAEEQNAGVL